MYMDSEDPDKMAQMIAYYQGLQGLCTRSMKCSGEIACTSTQGFVVHPLNLDLRSYVYSVPSSYFMPW